MHIPALVCSVLCLWQLHSAHGVGVHMMGDPNLDEFDLTPDMLDPGAKQLDELNKDVSATLGKIKEEEALRKERVHVAEQLSAKADEEKKVSKMRQHKFDEQIKEQDEDEEKKDEAGEEALTKKDEKTATQAKLPKREEAEWNVVVDREHGILTAEQPDPKMHEKFLTFNKYSAAMTEEEIANAKKLAALAKADGDASMQCDKCRSMCKTDTCASWCTLRWCKGEAADEIPLDTTEPLESQEAIVGDAEDSAVRPATTVVCKMCESPATEEKEKWCREQGC